MKTPNRTIHLSEEVLTEVVVRLPLRIIGRFKLLSKSWKATIESVYFRRLFVSLHKKSSTSWSLRSYKEEIVGFHGCETWDLRKSLAFFIPPTLHVIEASSHGLVLISEYDHVSCFVGIPVLRQWIKIPPPPGNDSSVLGLVTRVDDDGIVLGFKVVSLATNDYISDTLNVFLMYSSETGIWTSKILHCPYEITDFGSMTILNGTIYYSRLSESGVLAAYDFYSDESSDQFRVIPLPDHPDHDYKSSLLTTSGGYIMYIRTLAQASSDVFKAWRSNNDSSWQLLWNVDVPLIIGEYVPIAMHPFDSYIVYLWSQEHRNVLSCNSQKSSILRYADNDFDRLDRFVNQSLCVAGMDEICNFNASVGLLQLVLPPWMEMVPCPPQAEMMDTTSVVSYMQEAKRRQKGGKKEAKTHI